MPPVMKDEVIEDAFATAARVTGPNAIAHGSLELVTCNDKPQGRTVVLRARLAETGAPVVVKRHFGPGASDVTTHEIRKSRQIARGLDGPLHRAPTIHQHIPAENAYIAEELRGPTLQSRLLTKNVSREALLDPIEQTGAMLARVHAITPEERREPSLARFTSFAETFAARAARRGADDPGHVLARRLIELLPRCGHLTDGFGLTHGDANPRNVLLLEAGLGLIDFEQAGKRIFSYDLAAFLVRIGMICDPDGTRGPLPEPFVSRFERGYGAAVADDPVVRLRTKLALLQCRDWEMWDMPDEFPEKAQRRARLDRMMRQAADDVEVFG